jgi:hypothetical protein
MIPAFSVMWHGFGFNKHLKLFSVPGRRLGKEPRIPKKSIGF